MIPPLYEHQKNILKENKTKHGLFLGTGGGKTRIALELAEGRTLVVCPKQQREDKTWQVNADKFGIKTKLFVISKEDFRRDWRNLGQYDTFIVDECHNVLGVQPEVRQKKGVQIPKTSQIFEATLSFVRENPPKRFYLCSATPVSARNPMNMWAIATLFGEKWDFFKFRDKYYFSILLGGSRRVWMPRKGQELKDKMIELVKKFGYTGAIGDFVDLPDQIDKTVYIELGEAQKKALKELSQTEADTLVRASRTRTIENGVLYGKKIEAISDREDIMTNDTKIFPSKKIDYILERAEEFPKLLIFANYTAQINEIARVLTKEGYNVVTLTGSTKNRGTILKDAEKANECIVIAQSSVSSGWELPSYPCAIFASLSYRVVDYIQARGRILRMNHVKKNLYIHLVVKGGSDENCYKAIMSGNDFIEKVNTN